MSHVSKTSVEADRPWWVLPAVGLAALWMVGDSISRLLAYHRRAERRVERAKAIQAAQHEIAALPANSELRKLVVAMAVDVIVDSIE